MPYLLLALLLVGISTQVEGFALGDRMGTTPETARPTTIINECSEVPFEVVFVLDSSGSVGAWNFTVMKNFVKSVTERLNIGVNGTHVGVITYSGYPLLRFHLTDYLDQASLEKAIDEIPYLTGITETHMALDMLAGEGFLGARPGIARVGIVMTDGMSLHPNATVMSALDTQNQGITLFAVGIGPEINVNELKAIATDPDVEHIFEVANFKALQNITEMISTRTCKAKYIETSVTASPQVTPVTPEYINTTKNATIDCNDTFADILFILDTSGSVGVTHFQLVKQFVINIINDLDIGENQTKVGVITYSNYPQIRIALGQYSSKIDLLNAVNTIPYIPGGTGTDSALDLARSEGFKGERPDAPNIAIVVTDGYSTQPQLTKVSAEQLKLNGTTVFSIGVGEAIDKAELNYMASTPNSEFVFFVANFTDLSRIEKLVANTTCGVNVSAAVVPTPAPCYAKIADVMFVVDSSGSVGTKSFEIVKSFIKQMIDVFDVSVDFTRVGVITFNSGSKIEFALGQYSTSAENKQAIDNIRFTAGGTNTGEALENLRQNGFKNARAGVPNIAIVITDGLSNDPIVTKVQAKVLKDNGVTLIAIGVGNETDYAELRAIASVDQTTEQSMVYQVGSFEALQTLNSTVPTIACEVVVPTYIPPSTTTQATAQVTTGGCGNTVDNCDGYGRSVCSDYKPWATAHCAAYCGFCTGAATTPTPPCVNKIQNCAEYGTYVCTTTSMAKWAHDNCPLYCNFCGPLQASTQATTQKPDVVTTGQSATGGTPEPLATTQAPTNTTQEIVVPMSTTTQAPTKVTGGCENTVDNCDGYGRGVCSDYKPWATAHCAAYCGFCTGAATTAPLPCVNKIQNCAEYGTYVCTTTSMAKWAHDNCPLYCNFCGPLQASTQATTPAPGVITTGPLATDGTPEPLATTQTPTNTTQEPCVAKIADIMFVVDSSGSVGTSSFELVKSFIKEMVDVFDVNLDFTRVGVITFNSVSTIAFGLGRYNTSAENKQAIDKIAFTAGPTNTGEALENLRQNGFTNARPGVPNVAIVITDGLSNDPSVTKIQAKLLKDNGVTLIAIGVGNETNSAELTAIASVDKSTGQSMVYQVGSFEALQTLNSTVPYSACAAIVPTNVPITTQGPTQVTTGGCENTVDNCDGYGRSVCSDYKPWATAHCAAYCGFCTGAVTTPAPPCVDELPNCAEYGTDFCTTTSMATWAKTNCPLYCKFCEPTSVTISSNLPVSTAVTSGTASPAPVSGGPTSKQTLLTGETPAPPTSSATEETPPPPSSTGTTATPVFVSGEPTTQLTGSTAASPAPVSGGPTSQQTVVTGETPSPPTSAATEETPPPPSSTGATATPVGVSGEPTTQLTGSTASPAPVSGGPTSQQTVVTGETPAPPTSAATEETPPPPSSTGATATPVGVSGEPTTQLTGSTAASPAPVSGGPTSQQKVVTGETLAPPTFATATPVGVSGEPTTQLTGSMASPAPVSGGSTSQQTLVTEETPAPPTSVATEETPPSPSSTGATATSIGVSGEPTTQLTGSTASPAPVSGEPTTQTIGASATPVGISGEPTTKSPGSTDSPVSVSVEPNTQATGSTASPAPISVRPTTEISGASATPAGVSGQTSTQTAGPTATPIPASGEPTTQVTGSTASPAPVSGEPTTQGQGSTASPAPASGEPTTQTQGSSASPAPVSAEPTTQAQGSTASPAPISGEPTTQATASTTSPVPVSGKPTIQATGSTASPAPVSGEPTTQEPGSTASPAPVSGEPTTQATGSTTSPALVSGEPTKQTPGSTASPAPVSGEPTTEAPVSTASPAPVSGEPITQATGSTASPAPVSGEPTTQATGSTASPVPVSGEPTTQEPGSTASQSPVSGEPTTEAQGSTASPAPVSGEPITQATGSTASPAPVSGEPTTQATGSTASAVPVSGESTTQEPGSTSSPSPVSGEPTTQATGSIASLAPVSGESTTQASGSTVSPTPVSGEPSTETTGATATPVGVSGEPTTQTPGSIASPVPVSGEPTTRTTGASATPIGVSGEPTTQTARSTASPLPASGEPSTQVTGSTASPAPVSGEPTSQALGSTASPTPVSGEPTTQGTGSSASPAPVSGEPTTQATGSTASPAPVSGEPTTQAPGATASPALVSGEPTTQAPGSAASPASVSGMPTLQSTLVTGETPSPLTSAATEITPSLPSSSTAEVTPAPPTSSTTFETPTPQGPFSATPETTETSPIVSAASVGSTSGALSSLSFGTQTSAATPSPISPSSTTETVLQPGQTTSASTEKTNTTIPVSPSAPTSETCSSKVADVVFVIDSSGSVGSNSFESVKSFIKQSLNVFEIGTEYTRIGVITYSSAPILQFALNTYNTTSAIASAIDEIKYTAGSTDTSGALEMLRSQGFLNERPRVPNIAIVITDGLSNNPPATSMQAKLAKESGTILIAIGVGDQTDRAELTRIASVDKYSGNEMVFQVSSYQDLQTVQNTVVRYACNVAAATNPPPSTVSTTPSTESCINTMNNCADYGRSVCSDYKPWAGAHCALFCGFCQPSGNVTTTVKPCVDAIDNCAAYGTYICTSSSLASWTQKNCYRYCGLCPGGTTPTEPPTTTTTVAPECNNLLPNCQEYGRDACTSGAYRSWAGKNCREYCGFCAKFEVKPGVTLSNNQTCPSWRLPSECKLVQKDANCCPLPECPEGYELTVKLPNEE